MRSEEELRERFKATRNRTAMTTLAVAIETLEWALQPAGSPDA